MCKTETAFSFTASKVVVFILTIFFSLTTFAQHYSTRLPDSETARAPAITKHNGKLYIAYPEYGTHNIIVRSLDGSYFKKLSDKTGDTPALASFDGKLHLAYKSNSGERIYNKTMTGNSWSSTSKNASTTSDGPALQAYSGLLHMMFSSKSNDKLLYKWNDNGSWVSAINTGSGVNDSPSMAVHNGVLFAAYRSSDNANEILIRPYYGSNWGSSVRLNGTKTSDKPVLASSGTGLLYLVYKARHSDKVFIKWSYDGKNWTEAQDTGEHSRGTPGAVVNESGSLILAGRESYFDAPDSTNIWIKNYFYWQ